MLRAEALDETTLRRVFQQASREVPVGRDQHAQARTLPAARPLAAGLNAMLDKHTEIAKRFARAQN
ncbi:MAG TPA: hypothetical protein VLN59_11905, partial [Burkholderiales bacterium]|nr:hypothetical protein [Burkholderiales bacterium]